MRQWNWSKRSRLRKNQKTTHGDDPPGGLELSDDDNRLLSFDKVEGLVLGEFPRARDRKANSIAAVEVEASAWVTDKPRRKQASREATLPGKIDDGLGYANLIKSLVFVSRLMDDIRWG
jgi:hypothetical protein